MQKKTMFFWWLAAFLILAAVFISGVLKPQALPTLIGDYPSRPVNGRPHFDQTSEVLVENLIDARIGGSTHTPGGYMFRIPGDPRIIDVNNPRSYDAGWQPTASDLERRDLYSSQLGLQGRLYAAASERLGIGRSSALAVLRGLTAASLAAMLALLILLVRQEWGKAAALSALAICTVSTGFNLFAPSLYWITFAHVAPAAVTSAALLLQVQARPHWAAVHLLLFLLFVSKFLSGFEFLTVTILAAASPLLLVYSTGRLSGRLLLQRGALIVATGIAAFITAVAIYHIHHQQTLGQSGLAHLLSRGENWVAPADRGIPDQLLQFAKVLLVNVADYNGFGIPSFVAFAAGAGFVLLGARVLIRRSFDEAGPRIVLAIAATFLISTSWMVLQAEHVAFHPRYATILIAFPFGIFLAAGIARLLAGRAERSMRSAARAPIGASW